MGTPAGAFVLIPFALGRATEKVQESGQRVGQEWRVATTLDREAERPVQRRDLVGSKSPGLTLAQPDPGDTLSIDDLVVERHRIAAQAETGRQRFETLADVTLDQQGRIEHDPGVQELLPAVHGLELRSDPLAQRAGSDGR